MRISDWSSDVCSSDLADQPDCHAVTLHPQPKPGAGVCADHHHGHAAIARATAFGRSISGMWPQPSSTTLRLSARPARNAYIALISMTRSCRHHSSRSEEHKSELQYLMRTSYAVFCLKNNNTTPKAE